MKTLSGKAFLEQMLIEENLAEKIAGKDQKNKKTTFNASPADLLEILGELHDRFSESKAQKSI